METQEYKGFTIELHHDEFCDCPIDKYNNGIDSDLIVAIWQRNSNISDLNPFKAHEDAIAHALKHNFDMFNIRGYLHSDVGYTCDDIKKTQYPYNCRFDSGYAGMVLVKRSAFPERGKSNHGRRARIAEQTLETLTQWANGECYGFIIKDAACEELDSCWGYIGADWAIQAAQESIDHMTAKAA